MRWLLLSLVVVSAVLGDLLQSREMKEAGREMGAIRGFAAVVKVIRKRRLLILSMFCMAISFFAFLALINREPLSFAVPASAATFVLETVLAKFVLREQIDNRRAAGGLCVLAGILLIAR